MTSALSTSRKEARLDAAAAQDASRIASERDEVINAHVDPNRVTQDEAAKIMSEEHRILGYRPPADSLAAQAQSAADKKASVGEDASGQSSRQSAARNDARLSAAAAQDATRIATERGEQHNAQVDLNNISKEEASKIMSEEHKILKHRPPADSLAAQAQSAADKHLNEEPIVTKELAANLMSQEHKGMGHRPPPGSIAAQAQSLADKNSKDGGSRTMDDAIIRAARGEPVTKEMASQIMSEEERALGDIPKGSLGAQAQSVADQNARDGGKRTLYES